MPQSDQIFLDVKGGLAVVITDTDVNCRMSDVIHVIGSDGTSKVLLHMSIQASLRGSTVTWCHTLSPVYENAVRFNRMKLLNPAYLGGNVIFAIMVLAVFVGATNASDCSRSMSADATSIEAYHKAEVDA